MPINFQIQTKLEASEVSVAAAYNIHDDTTTKEMVAFVQELRNHIKHFEDGLYHEWLDQEE